MLGEASPLVFWVGAASGPLRERQALPYQNRAPLHQTVVAPTLKSHPAKSCNMTLTSISKHGDESLLDGFSAQLYNRFRGRP